ncbi:hypothetical protein BY458DRAFT_529394 [Sporodiniella umbellata]|nr:hypothetical protein BY458DRAFT_529394 [Sporodiniella umbellata]
MSSLLTFQLRQQQPAEPKQQENSQSGIPSPPNSFCGEEQSNPEHGRVVEEERRDSLQTVFNDMCIGDYSLSLPDNYTIEHSTTLHPRKASHALSTATAAATGGLTIRNNRRQSDALKRKTSRMGLSESFGHYRCHDCGKSYKHPNCLQKHRWEHSEEWELTKSLPLTKHQQVQMLEAAAILIGMDRRGKSPITQELEEEEEDDDDDEEEIDVFRIEEDEDDESIVIDDEDEIQSLHSQEIFMDDI